MTEYSDLPQVNSLYTEQQQIETAIGYLQNGGTVTNMTMAAAPPPAPTPPDPDNPTPPTPPVLQPPVRIELTEPPSQAFVNQVISALNQRSDDITSELGSLGVTNPPARSK